MRGIYRTETETEVGAKIADIFSKCADTLEVRIENFPKYVRRQHLKRFLAMYEIFKLAQPVKGSVIECGVYKGFGLMAWSKISTILEPENLTRKIYGFDTFEGFPALSAKDQSKFTRANEGDLCASSHDELVELINEYDRDRFLGHIPKVSIIKGDITRTVKEFVRDNPHLLVSLLFVDCDLYEPTKAALEAFIPRMPKGAVLAFDELDNPIWPGETLALLETLGLRNAELRRLEWDPYISFTVL